jgi:hypothetical protein
MSDPNYGFKGAIPEGASIQYNIDRALAYQSTHTTEETLAWFDNYAKSNEDLHLPKDPLLYPDHSMDYKVLNKTNEYGEIIEDYADFGNFNYAVKTTVHN